jgi:hypothetical protein
MKPASILENQKLITCYLPKGKGVEIVVQLNEEKKLISANFASGRGRGMAKTVGFGEWMEVDILSVVVEESKAEEIFDFIFDIAGIDRPNGGLMIQGDLTQATPFTLPDF